MDIMQNAMCKLAMNEEFWDSRGIVKIAEPGTEPQIKTHAPAASNSYDLGGMKINKNTALAALIGAGILPGVGAMSGKLSAKQLFLLALLGGGVGGLGMEALRALEEPAKNSTNKGGTGDTGEGDKDPLAGVPQGFQDIYRGTSNAADDAATYGGLGVGASLLAKVGPASYEVARNPNNLKAVATAPSGAGGARLKAYVTKLNPDADLKGVNFDLEARYIQEWYKQNAAGASNAALSRKFDDAFQKSRSGGFKLKDVELPAHMYGGDRTKSIYDQQRGKNNKGNKGGKGAKGNKGALAVMQADVDAAQQRYDRALGQGKGKGQRSRRHQAQVDKLSKELQNRKRALQLATTQHQSSQAEVKYDDTIRSNVDLGAEGGVKHTDVRRGSDGQPIRDFSTQRAAGAATNIYDIMSQKAREQAGRRFFPGIRNYISDVSSKVRATPSPWRNRALKGSGYLGGLGLLGKYLMGSPPDEPVKPPAPSTP